MTKGFVNLGYRGNNSRIDKILKKGKQYYKLSANAVSMRCRHTVGVYKEARGIVMFSFVLVNSADEETYWKLANKALSSPKDGDRVNLQDNEDGTGVALVFFKGKCKKFPVQYV
jgi:hypothetical protein